VTLETWRWLGLRPGNASLLLSHRLGGNEWQLVQRSGPLIALNLEGGLPAAADNILPLAVSIGSPLWILTQAAVLRPLLPHGTISCTGKTDAFVERTSIDSVALE